MRKFVKPAAIVLFIIAGYFSITIPGGIIMQRMDIFLGGTFLTFFPLLSGLWLWRKYCGGPRQAKSSHSDVHRASCAYKESACLHCGRKRKPLEEFTKYGLCHACDKEGRDTVKRLLAMLQSAHDIFYGRDIVEFSRDHPEAKDSLHDMLNTIADLEDMRPQLPFFKSSLEDKRVFFTDLLAQLNDVSPPSAANQEKNGPLIRSYFYDRVYVAGCQHYDTAEVEPDMDLELIAEPENEYDENAIQVVCEGDCIGYIAKGRHQEMILDYWKRGEFVEAKVVEVEDDNVFMSLAFYR